MKNPLSHSASLSTPGLLLGKTGRAEESSEAGTERKVSESRLDSGTFTMRSTERKSLIEEGRWLSLDRRGKTSRQSSAAAAGENGQGEQEERSDSRPDSRPDSDTVTRPKSPGRSKSRERSQSPDKEGDVKKVKSFWVDLDNDTQRKKSQEKSFSSREKKKSHSRSRSVSRGKSVEPAPDYDQSSSSVAKSKSSKIKRGSQVVKKKRDLETPTYNEGALIKEYNRGRRESSLEPEFGGNYPLVKVESNNNSRASTLNRTRRGTIYDENINRDGFINDNNAVVAKRSNSNNPDESKHFLSLQLFNKVNGGGCGGGLWFII